MQVTESAVQTVREVVETYSDEIVPMGLQNLDDGRECTVCDGSEYETVSGTAVYRISRHTTECRCGGEVVARAVRVEIGGHLPFGQTRLLEAYCSECGEVSERTGRIAVLETEAVEEKVRELDVEVLEETHPLHRHHTSYAPAETILVCESCHSRIHHSAGFREDLVPDQTRSEWEATLDD